MEGWNRTFYLDPLENAPRGFLAEEMTNPLFGVSNIFFVLFNDIPNIIYRHSDYYSGYSITLSPFKGVEVWAMCNQGNTNQEQNIEVGNGRQFMDQRKIKTLDDVISNQSYC